MKAFQCQQQEAVPHPGHSLPQVQAQRRASLDTLTQSPLLSSSAAVRPRSQPKAKATHPTPPTRKRSNSQPSLHLLSHPEPSIPPQEPNPIQPSTPQQNSRELMLQNDHHLPITSFPRRCSPKIINRHKRTVSVASSINSAVPHQHPLLMLNRHQFNPDEENDEIEIEGGMSGLLRAAEEEENQLLDYHQLDDRRGSESCGSSAIGEPMAVDGEPTTSKPSSFVGAKKVRRRPVNRANLLPRPRAHLRVAAQLSTEEVSPDLLTEAEVHRRFKSVPFVGPQASSSTPTHTLPSTTPSNSPLIPRTPSSPFYHQPHRPTPNRFPEQVDDDVEDNRLEAPSSGSDDEPLEDHQSHCSGLRHSVISQDEESEDHKILEIQKWKMFRGSGSGASCGPMEMNRGGKRRCQDSERFEPGMFKRRAVSPSSTSLSSCIGSPILNPVSISHSTLGPTTTTTTPTAATTASSSTNLNQYSIHQPITVNSSSSSSSVSSIGFRGSLSVHQHLIHNRNSVPTPDRDDLPMSNHSSNS